MRRVELSINVVVDDEVTSNMVRDLLRNQLPMNPVVELATGAVHWRETQVNVVEAD
jgi:hypothetical protein